MLKVFYGEDRLAAEKVIKTQLGADYEVFEGEVLTVEMLPSIFQGATLFNAEKRRILLKDVGENAAVWEKVAGYAQTEHEVIVWENKLDKRSVGYKELKAAGVELVEFPAKKPPEANLVFNIFDTALRDGPAAVKMCSQIELTQEPYMFFGLMVTQALKKYSARQGVRERRILKQLAELDMQMKTTSIEPWTLVKSFLLRVGKN